MLNVKGVMAERLDGNRDKAYTIGALAVSLPTHTWDAFLSYNKQLLFDDVHAD